MNLPHTLIAILINILWGSMFIVGTIGLSEFPPIFFTGIRFAVLAILLVGFLRIPKKTFFPLLRIGIVMGIGMYLTLYLSLALAENTGTVAIFSKLEVPLALLLGVALLGERVAGKQIIGIIVALLGAAFVTFDPAAFDDLLALSWMAICCLFAALGLIEVRRLGKIHPLTIVAWISLIGAPVLLATSFLFEKNHLEVLQTATWIGWSSLLYTAFMSSIVATSGLYYLLQRYPVTLVAPFGLLSPIFAVIGGVIFLEDVLTVRLVLGGGLILLGVTWVNRPTPLPKTVI
ncbi:MAG: hypothetical protein CL402_01805 [Acidiferrobacteraceae bacterium]|nr:hypothetical protein [Acidiferrobacteraceae bacterium]|tara:strand:- start:45 stop:911 length:867 start_codon:yes stop_codon:yes gene_type:complete